MRFFFVAAVVLAVGCGESATDRATRYLQAAEEVKVEESKLSALSAAFEKRLQEMIGQSLAVVSSAGPEKDAAMVLIEGVLRNESLSQAEKDAQIEAIKNASIRRVEDSVKKATADTDGDKAWIEEMKAKIASQMQVVTAARKRRDDLASKN